MHSTEGSSRSPLCGQPPLAPPALRIGSWLCSGSPAGERHIYRGQKQPEPSALFGSLPPGKEKGYCPAPRLHGLGGRLFVPSFIHQTLFLSVPVDSKTDRSHPHRTYSFSLGLSFLIIKWVGKRGLDGSISSSAKISESVILDYKHLSSSHSVSLSHLYPMPKRRKQ